MANGSKTGGRPKGAPDGASLDASALAVKFAPDAIAELARLSTEAESEATRLGAIKELLDRAYGKVTQARAGEEEDPVAMMLTGVRETLAAKLDRIARTRTGEDGGGETDGSGDTGASL